MTDVALSKKQLAKARAASKKTKKPFMGLFNNESIKVQKPVK